MPTADETRLTTGRLLLGASLRARRTEAGLQLAELAELAGLSQAYLSDIERGNKLPSLQTLDAIAVSLDTSAAELLHGIYPWGSTQRPAQPASAPPDGRAGRKIGRRKPPAKADPSP